MNKVTIYTTPTCAYCKMAKAFFANHTIQYKEIDVSSDEEGASVMIEKSGQMGVPVIIVENDGKEELVVGFQENVLKKLLKVS